jgi:hypothetical protein
MDLFNLFREESGDAGAEAVAEELGKVPGLTSLDLRSKEIGDKGAEAVAKKLGKVPGLTFLDLGYNKIGEKGAAALAKELGKVPGLTSLELGFNKIGEKGAAALAKELSKVPGLTSLNLMGNQIGEKGAAALVPELGKVPGLTSLNLGGNDIGVEGARVLAGVLGGMVELTSLELGYNHIGDEGMWALARELGQLTSLFLGGNDIGVEGARALAQAGRLGGLARLKLLSMDRNCIGVGGALALAGLGRMEGLDIIGVGIHWDSYSRSEIDRMGVGLRYLFDNVRSGDILSVLHLLTSKGAEEASIGSDLADVPSHFAEPMNPQTDEPAVEPFPPGGDYEVFICHRGPDTKKQFASFLHYALGLQNISAFFDYEMVGGSRAPATIESAMQVAKWGIVILSPQFFESKWCMKELQYFLEQEKVLPVTLGLSVDDCHPDKIVNKTGPVWQKHGGRLWVESEMTESHWRDVVTNVSKTVIVTLERFDGNWAKLINELVLIVGKKLGKPVLGGRVMENITTTPPVKVQPRPLRAEYREPVGYQWQPYWHEGVVKPASMSPNEEPPVSEEDLQNLRAQISTSDTSSVMEDKLVAFMQNFQEQLITAVHRFPNATEQQVVFGLMMNASIGTIKEDSGTQRTLLHYLAMNGVVVLLKALVDTGFDVNSKDSDLRTPLHLAVMGCHADAVEVLVQECQADVNIGDLNAALPWHYAYGLDVGSVVDNEDRTVAKLRILRLLASKTNVSRVKAVKPARLLRSLKENPHAEMKIE